MRNLLDEDRPDTVRLSEAEARALSLGTLAKCGYGEADATLITGQLVDNALCGYPFASLPRILTIAGEARNRETRTEPRIVRETASSALADGGNTIGSSQPFAAPKSRRARRRTRGSPPPASTTVSKAAVTPGMWRASSNTIWRRSTHAAPAPACCRPAPARRCLGPIPFRSAFPPPTVLSCGTSAPPRSCGATCN